MIETTYSDRLPAGKDAPKRKQKLRAARARERKSLKRTAHTVASLTRLATRLGFWPKFVFDRGFCNEGVIKALTQSQATCYVRAKAGRVIEFDGQKTPLAQLVERDSTIQLVGLRLRVIRSVDDGRNDEPWYILTNDFASAPEQIITIYYHRFEIEEAFRDSKQIFGLARTRLNKPNSLQSILWLVAIGLALRYLAEDADQKQSRQSAHPKK
jgi:IS4 transposase